MIKPIYIKKARAKRFVGDRGPHTLYTEARDTEEAVDLLLDSSRYPKNRKCKSKPRTLRQEFALARLHAKSTKERGGISLPFDMHSRKTKHKAKPRPHPLKDLSLEQKRAKVKEMYESDTWGWGTVAFRRLAKAFGVPIGHIITWVKS